MGDIFAMSPAAGSPRRQLYAPVLSQLRVVMVEKMSKPEDVLVVEDESGEV